MKSSRILAVILLSSTSFLHADNLDEPFPQEPGLLSGAGAWEGEESAGAVKITAGSLKFDGLAPSRGNRAHLPATASKVHEATLTLPASFSDIWGSFLLRVDKPEATGKNPFTLLRLFNKQGNTAAAGLYLRKGQKPEEFIILASKRANPEKVAASPSPLAAGKPHLIVFHLDTTAQPHALQVWIDPAPAAFGAENAPDPTFTAAEGVDVPGALDSVAIGGGVGSPGVFLDELRLGPTWAEVTPTR